MYGSCPPCILFTNTHSQEEETEYATIILRNLSSILFRFAEYQDIIHVSLPVLFACRLLTII